MVCDVCKAVKRRRMTNGRPRGWRCDPCEARLMRERRKCNPDPYRADRDRPNGLIRKFGITIEEFDALLASQGGVCAICRNTGTAKRKDGAVRHLDVDHNHVTGEVRGLLCRRCNLVIGSFEDDPDLVLRASEYLRARK